MNEREVCVYCVDIMGNFVAQCQNRDVLRFSHIMLACGGYIDPFYHDSDLVVEEPLLIVDC
jgi:hypothetical protein